MEHNDKHLLLKGQLCFPIYALSREIIKIYRPYLEPLDLTYTQYIAMLVFWEEKKLSVKELGKKLYLDSGTLTPVLKSLEAKGYVDRYRSSYDERVLIVEITPKGEELKQKANEIPYSMVKHNRSLSHDELKQLYYLVTKLLVNEENK